MQRLASSTKAPIESRKRTTCSFVFIFKTGKRYNNSINYRELQGKVKLQLEVTNKESKFM